MSLSKVNIKLLKKQFVFQQDQSDCGVACLASIINFHGGTCSIETLRRASGTSRQGTTLLGLLQGAQLQGFDAFGLEADKVENLNELTEPAILHIVLDNRLQHYVVFYGFKNDRIIVGDPANGIIEYSYEQLNKYWQSKALLKLVPNDKFEKKSVYLKKRREWIFELIRDDYPLLLISLFLGIIISILGISTAILSKELIDEILPNNDVEKLALDLFLVLFILLARSGLNFLRGLFMARQGMEFNNRIIQSFYGSLLRLPKSFFDTRKIGELIARMNDTRRIQLTLSILSGNILIDALIIIVSTVFVFGYSFMIGLVMIVFLVFYYLTLIGFTRPIVELQKKTMSEYAFTESNFVDTMQGIVDIKLSNKVRFFESLNKSIYESFQLQNFELGKIALRFGMIADIIGVVFTICVFGLTSWLVLNNQLMLGEMVGILGISIGIVPSATRLIVANIQLQEARIAFDRMFEFTSVEKENYKKVNTTQWNLEKIEIRNLSFRFPGRKEILKDVSLIVNKGEIVSLIGENGGGKSTILQLIQKFYENERGRILYNNKDGNVISIQEIREQVGYIPQDLKIFNNHLLFNITLSESQEDYERAITFCEHLGLSNFFQSFPQGYMTLLGEEGINISGGQKQLVILARALFRNPKFLLLDEATSAMDRNTENFILELFQKLKSEMGILMVTHRIKTAKRSDRIYILENGLISMSGSHEELMMTENFYSESFKEIIT
jgi:ABC-type bacteriocin/lantibiotic exporter with double-glycine peptidase domain